MYQLKRICLLAFLFGFVLHVVVMGAGFGGDAGGGMGTLWPFGNGRFDVTDGISVQATVMGAYTIQGVLPSIRSDVPGAQRVNGAIASDFAYAYAAKNGSASGRMAIGEAFSGWVNPSIRISYETGGMGATKTVTIHTEVESETAMQKVELENRYLYNMRTDQLRTEQSAIL